MPTILKRIASLALVGPLSIVSAIAVPFTRMEMKAVYLIHEPTKRLFKYLTVRPVNESLLTRLSVLVYIHAKNVTTRHRLMRSGAFSKEEYRVMRRGHTIYPRGNKKVEDYLRDGYTVVDLTGQT